MDAEELFEIASKKNKTKLGSRIENALVRNGYNVLSNSDMVRLYNDIVNSRTLVLMNIGDVSLKKICEFLVEFGYCNK